MHIMYRYLLFLCTEWSVERQVLHSQCKRLEAQNYNLTRTAEQLSLTMGVSICMPTPLFLAQLCTWCKKVTIGTDVYKSYSLVQKNSWFCNESRIRPSFVRSWWVRGSEWEKRESDCRPSSSTSGDVWHYLTFTGAGGKSTGTCLGDLLRRLSGSASNTTKEQ